MRTLRRLNSAFGFQTSAKWIILATVVGLTSGIAAIAFDVLGQLIIRLTLVHVAGYSPPEALGEFSRFDRILGGPTAPFSPWWIVLIMTAGGLASGLLVYTFAPEAAGAGTDAALDAFHNRQGRIQARIPFVKTLASAITLGTGGSGGREGPIAQICAGFASALSAKLKLSNRERRILLAAGMGAGVGAIFRAPLAGAIFAGEILYSDADLEADVILPSSAAAVIAYSVYTQSLPAESRFVPLFGEDLQHLFSTPFELLPYGILAIVLTIVAIGYVRVLHGTRQLFEKLPIVPHLRPAIGAGLAGLAAIGLLYLFRGDARVLGVLGTGYGSLQVAVTAASQMGIPLLLAIAVGKTLTAALTISSGGAGGVFGPSMVIGGCIGASIGLTFQAIVPSLVSEPEAFAVVGMAGFFAGVARAPISTIIMVRALTGDYGLLLPTMLVSTLTFFMCRRFRLYEKQVPTRMDSRAHRGDFIVDVLEGLRVEDIYRNDQNVVRISEGMSLDEIVHGLAYTNQHYFPVIDSEDNMIGIFSDEDVRAYLYDDTLWKLVNAEDVMISNFISVSPEDNLNTALKRFTSLNLDELPVIHPDQPRKLLGMLRRKETIDAYNRRLVDLKRYETEH
ncbi:chloride channel protein [Stieleria sp. JC731]|uniref:chloride channel protein n=1 Tax=Pirellulaceae TaxID=2691357 RepID=UPI001E5AED44|nr:chloride channel protein [Stieleria sp. JC731]MCC9601152.1 chloride channel protein [Stieleria sp. JC731]